MPHSPDITTGNIKTDSENGLICYIVGYGKATKVIHKNNKEIAIRGVKYSTHPKGEIRPEDTDRDDEIRITILLKGGPWRQSMWINSDKGDLEHYTLRAEGDYMMWEPGYYHRWEACEKSTMLTVSLYDPSTSRQ